MRYALVVLILSGSAMGDATLGTEDFESRDVRLVYSQKHVSAVAWSSLVDASGKVVYPDYTTAVLSVVPGNVERQIRVDASSLLPYLKAGQSEADVDWGFAVGATVVKPTKILPLDIAQIHLSADMRVDAAPAAGSVAWWELGLITDDGTTPRQYTLNSPAFGFAGPLNHYESAVSSRWVYCSWNMHNEKQMHADLSDPNRSLMIIALLNVDGKKLYGKLNPSATVSVDDLMITLMPKPPQAVPVQALPAR